MICSLQFPKLKLSIGAVIIWVHLMVLPYWVIILNRLCRFLECHQVPHCCSSDLQVLALPVSLVWSSLLFILFICTSMSVCLLSMTSICLCSFVNDANIADSVDAIGPCWFIGPGLVSGRLVTMQMTELVVCWQQLELFGVVPPLQWWVWESGDVLATGLVISPSILWPVVFQTWWHF